MGYKGGYKMKVKTVVLTGILAILLFLAGCSFNENRQQTYKPALTTPTPYVSRTYSTPKPKAKPTPRPTPKPTPKPTPRPTPRPTTKPGTGTRRSILPSPDTSGYYSAEDFYDWYRDDFIDYEDAEDYYYSHGGW